MSDSIFQSGDVVQLRSGGPLLTVTYASAAVVDVVYHNAVTGTYEKFDVPVYCLRSANEAPQVPGDARTLRHTTVARSSL